MKLLHAAPDHRSSTTLREAGCTCEFGCMNCQMDESQMGNCPSFNACPMGRAPVQDCPVHKDKDRWG